MNVIFETERLVVRKAELNDSAFILSIWTDTSIMRNVGFPRGIQIAENEIKDIIQNQNSDEYDKFLIVVIKENMIPIGECKLGSSNKKNIAHTDIKLIPEFHRKGYGKELKKGLLKYLFRNTECEAVEASPNILNTASIKMQESVGGKRICKNVYQFPENMKDQTETVISWIYRVYREDFIE